MAIDELIIHAGTPKTGTTSLQFVLGRNRRVLGRNGVLLPPYFWKQTSHKWLALSTFQGDKFQNAPSANPPGRRLTPSYISRRVALARAWITAYGSFPGYKKMLLSAETFSSINRREECERLEKILSVVSPKTVSLVIYVRSPVGYFVSRFLQDVKARGTLRRLNNLDPLSHVVKFLGVWARVFDGKILVNEYARSSLLRGDIVEDFVGRNLTEVRVDELDKSIPIRRENRSISIEAATLLHDFRRDHFPDAPTTFRPSEFVAFERGLRKAEVEIGSPPRPKLREDVERAIWAASQESLEFLTTHVGVTFSDGPKESFKEDCVSGSRSSEIQISDIFELDERYTKILKNALNL